MWAEALDVDDGASARAAASTCSGSPPSRDRRSSTAACISTRRRVGALARSIPRARSPAQIAPLLARPVAPIWMDSSTTAECAAIARGRRRRRGAGAAHRVTRVRTLHRTADPEVLRSTSRPATPPPTASIWSARSSRRCSPGGHAPVDPGDASGMNLMDLASRPVVAAGARRDGAGLAAKLPPIAPSSDDRRRAVTVLAGAPRPAPRQGRRLVRRQPVQPRSASASSARGASASRSARATPSSD